MKKKFWTACIAIVAILCAGIGLGACNNGGGDTHFTVTYVYHDDVTPDSTVTVESGKTAPEPKDPERDGYRFRYWYETGADKGYDFMTPVTANLTLNAAWDEIVPEEHTYSIKWTAFEGGSYVGEDHAALPSSGKENTTVRFGLDLSPYYTDSAVVKINRKSVQADADGFYTVTLERDTTVEVEGVKEDLTPFEGRGTQTEPYLIKTAGQMKLLAEHVNLKEIAYARAHYRLENDIDFKNYEYTVIGNTTSAKFYGSFDGNGHTLANMKITEPKIETVTDGNTVSNRAYLGVIGMAAVTSADPSSASVSNLAVTGLNIDVDADASIFCGGIIGYGIGATLWNCTVEGNMHVKTTGGYFSFTGGLVGIHQSAMDASSDIPYYANAMYCVSEVNIMTEGYANSAGGIAGYLLSDGGATAFVINSYARGNVSGAMFTGGIVGQMSESSSVANVYATGDVYAESTINSEDYAFAGAGGIVGYAANQTAVQNSFATGAYAAASVAGERYAFADGLAGITLKDAALNVTSRSLLLRKCYYAEGGFSGQYDFAKKETLQTVLGWQECDWSFDPDDLDYPTIQEDYIPAEQAVTLAYGAETVSSKDETVVPLDQDGNAYLPITYWYANGEIAPSLTADERNGKTMRSFGLFFDEDCTQPVPDAYILVRSETFYYGWADYTTVAGEYVFELNGERATLEVTDAGVAYYRHGPIRQTISYTYGNRYGDDTAPKITFYDAYFCSLYHGSLDRAGTDYVAGVENGVLTLTDATFYPVGAELYAYGDNALIGTWYADGGVYEFRANRTCTFGATDGVYEVAGDVVTVTVGGVVYTGSCAEVGETLQLGAESGALTLARVDILKGIWESEINHSVMDVYQFDGKGGYQRYRVQYENYYDRTDPDKVTLKQRKVKVGETVSGTYEYRGDYVTFADQPDVIGTFDKDGLLNLVSNGYAEVFGRENGFRGTWVDEWINDGEGYTMTLSGIGKDGTGTMYDSNGYVAVYALDEDGMLTMYVGTVVYGMGNYQANNLPSDPREKKGGMLYCAIYTPESGMLVDDYNLAHHDRFEGNWTTADGTLGDLAFNGYGDYDLHLELSSGSWIVEGVVTVAGQKIRYYNDSDTVATFVYDGKTYTVTFSLGKLGVSDGTDTYVYVRHDRFADYEWLAADGARASFNGKGEIGDGEVTLTAADGTVSRGAYTVTADGATITVDGAAMTAERNAETGCLEITADGETTVYGVDNGFTGSWAVQGGGMIRIGALGENFRGTGEYVTDAGSRAATFRLATSYALAMTYTEEADASQSFTLYLMLLDEGEMVLSPYSTLIENTYLICARPDEMKGVWTGTDATIDFDGVGNSQYTYGLAKLTVGEKTETYYYYSVDGAWALYGITAGGVPVASYVIGGGDDTEMTFTKDGVIIGLYESDGLFGVAAVTEAGKTFRFNGLSAYGKGEMTDGVTVYGYEDVVQGEDGTVTLKLTDSQGQCYTGIIVTEIDGEGNPVNKITMSPCASAAA